jgi:RAB6A-GEF complex partner protein 2
MRGSPVSDPGFKVSSSISSSASNGHIALPTRERQERTAGENLRLVTRFEPTASKQGTPRSSFDLYTMSNNSTETLASEYITPTAGRARQRTVYSRQQSHLSPLMSPNTTETIMMGYVQLVGSFTLDGALVNLAPFEPIKRKGVIGGQGGGGVVGLEPLKRESGLLGALGLAGIGQSLGDLLGGPEMSSIKEMKGVASARSIPIITTPQSILFVDMRLGPGQSKSFKYSHPLPKDIPPSHKGRAMKVTYQLVVATQRAQSVAKQNQIRHVEIPFKVLPGVDRT